MSRHDSAAGASDYARQLLKSLGHSRPRLAKHRRQHPALSWARSGLMALTGPSVQALMCPAALAACADGGLLALRSLAQADSPLDQLQGADLLTERAACMGLTRSGAVAPGGSCRLLDAADGRLAINLARPDDWAMLPAWLPDASLSGEAEEWAALTNALKTQPLHTCIERGRLMGLAVAPETEPEAGADWVCTLAEGERSEPVSTPLVLDLSTLWAGPLCAHLLQALGARVIKVESPQRPDGARQGDGNFYALLNQGKECLSLDLGSPQGRAQLKALIARADIVIESARPRGLAQMGIVAEERVANTPGLTWISITGYGRGVVEGEWVGFGDDAAIAAGLSWLMREVRGESVFVGDAIADPLTGLHAALAGWHSHSQGGGRLLSLSLQAVTAYCAGYALPETPEARKQRYRAWSDMVSPDDVRAPVPRYAAATARPMGADNEALMAEFGL